MIEWNPAQQPPPDNKVDICDLPDLSGFVNAWDLPMDKQTIWIAPEPQHIHHSDMNAGESASHTFPWETSVATPHHPSRIWLHENVENASPAPESDEYIQAQMNKIVDDLEATTLDDHDYNVQPTADTMQHYITLTSSPAAEHHHVDVDQESRNTYAMDAIVSTTSPGRRSLFLPLFEEETIDNDWSARDMIPIPLKPTSKRHLHSPRSITPKSPRSPRSPKRFFLEGAPAQSSKLYAHEPVMFSKKTPYSSVAATPVAEKDVYFGDNELFEVDVTETSTGVAQVRDFLSGADYSIDKPLTTLRREHRSMHQNEQHYEGERTSGTLSWRWKI